MSDLNQVVTSLEEWQAAMDRYLSGGGDLDDTVTALERWKIDMDAYLKSQQPPAGTMPAHRMGVHWIPGSNRRADHDYMRALRPGVLKIVSLDKTRIMEAYSYVDSADKSVLVLRDHPLSEQKDDMTRDPYGTGIRHAREWVAKLEGPLSFLDHRHIAVCGINEPFVRSDSEEVIAAAYTDAFLRELTANGVRGLALNLSVGWPRNLGPGLPPYWDNFSDLEDVINRGNHFLCVHEYWRNDPDDSWFEDESGFIWGWYAHRHWACPMSVPVIIGECGLTKNVAGQPAPGQNDGWIGNVSPETYAEQLWRYADKCHPNVLGVMPFTTDMASEDWQYDDTLPAHNQILARKHNTIWPSPWPVPTDAPDPTPESDPDLLILPDFAGKITGFYGQIYSGPRSHEGLDISKVVGVPVYAPADGIVAYSDTDPAYGEYVRTYHEQLDVCFFFAHLSRRVVGYRQEIKQGDLLGYTGNTGNSTGPHLHLEVRAMTPDGAYKPAWSHHSRARNDPLGFLTGWLAAGKRVEYK